jgi:hypothetical protein
MDQKLIDIMAANGRTPAFDAHGNVRGFRSRPGAPPADLTKSTGYQSPSQRSRTPDNVWDDMFKDQITKQVPQNFLDARAVRNAQPGAPTPMGTPATPPAVPASPGAMDKVLEDVTASHWGFAQPKPPSLDEPFKFSLAGGGPSLPATPSTGMGRPAFTPPRQLAPIGQNQSPAPTPLVRPFQAYGAKWRDVSAAGGTQRDVRSQFGWGSSFIPS